MDLTPDDRRAAGPAASEVDRFAEAYRLLLPLAEAGDAVAQGVVGSLLGLSAHRFEGLRELEAGGGTIDPSTAVADRERAAHFLRAASAAGVGPASFNLAGLYVGGYGGGSWEERKARAAELYALAYAQGFTTFGGLTCGEGPGQPYLDIMERHGAAGPTAGGPGPAEPVTPPDGGGIG